MILRFCILFCAITFIPIHCLSQARPSVPVTIRLKNGSEYQGKMLETKSDSVTLVSASDTLRIPLREITSIDQMDEKRRSERWDESPNVSKYFFTNSAIPLEQGDFIYHNTYFFLNGVQAGVTDRITVGGGADIFGGSVYYLNAKVALWHKPKYTFSAGVNYFRIPKDIIEEVSGDDIRNLGMVYGAGTWGNTNNNFTIGVGYMFLRSTPLPPIITISGATRFSKRFALVSENWFLFVGEQLNIPALLSGGLRYIGDEWTLDVSAFTDHKFSGEAVLPYVSYSRRLGW